MTVMDNRDSVQLFASTSKRPVLEEELTSKDFRQLMEQLGGHPLSIVIMARQLTHGMTIGELTKRIEVEKAKAIQISGISDRPFEHGESLIATLLSSFENLDQFSKEMFISLSMLPTGAFKPTTENIFGNDAWDVVHKLVDASLGEIASQRITLLPPVRLFAANFLSKSLKRKYAPKIVDYMAHYAQWCYNGLGTKDAILFRSAFELEEPNFRYAVELTTIFKAGKSTHALSKIGLLAHYLMSLYDLNYRENEAISLGYFIVSKLEEIGDSEGLARVLHEIAYLIADKGQLDESKQILEKALEIFNELHAFDGEVNTLIQLGHVMIVKQDFPKAKEYLENALGKVQEWGKKNPEGGKCGEADTYNQFAYLFQFMNDLSKAKQFQEKALKIYQEIGEKMGESASFFRMGYYSRLMNDFPKAKDYLENAVKTAQQIGAKETEAYSFEELGKVFISTNDFLKAKEYLEKALKLCQEIGDINSCEKTKRLIIQIDDLQTGKRS
jgi:tetratricopeptide (TPR) repeat protein